MLSPEVIAFLAIQPGDRILHLRCGDGAIARQLAALVPLGVVVGVDPDDDQVRAARAASTDIENVLFVNAGIEEIPWKADYFSHALLDQAFSEMGEVYRVLAPSGKVFLLDEGKVSAVPGPDS